MAGAVACASAQHLSVHEPVDDLCKRAARLCADGRMLGIAAASSACVGLSTWENTIHMLCITKLRHCPHAAP